MLIGQVTVEVASVRGNRLLTGRAAGWLLVVCAVLPYAATRNYPHVHDDEVLRGVGSLVSDARADSAMLLTADFFGTWEQPRGHTGFWRPLVTLSFRLEHWLAGDSRQGYVWLGHVLTILCHAAATLALWRLALACGLSPGGALVAGAWFAVAPIHVESVAWASGRVDSLPAALAWGGTALWISRRGSMGSAGLAALAFAAALLSKETAVLLVALAVPLARLAGLSWRASVLPPAGALLGVLLLRAAVFGLGHDISEEAWTGPADTLTRWLTWLSICPDLAGLLVWPGAATPIRPVAPAASLGSPGVLAGLATVVLSGLLVVLAWRRRDAVLVLAAALLAGTFLLLAPWLRFPLGFVEQSAPQADRYLYAAAAVPGLALGRWLGTRIDRARRAAWLVPVLLLVGLGPVTAARAETMWSSDTAFAEAALAVAPGSANLWAKHGEARLLSFQATGRPEVGIEALASLERALVLQADHRLAALNRFIVLALLGRDGEALSAADGLLRRWPDDPYLLDNVAAWHMGHGRWGAALSLLERELATGRALAGAREAADACRRALAGEDPG